jgi:limonene-1,2-epoxide hydrolase
MYEPLVVIWEYVDGRVTGVVEVERIVTWREYDPDVPDMVPLMVPEA